MRVLPIIILACWQLSFAGVALAIEPDVSTQKKLVPLDVAAKKTRDVKKIELDGKKYWVSACAIPMLPFDTEAYAKRKLTLLTKASIANAAGRGRSNSSVSISGFHLGGVWADNNWWHGVGYVLEKNVTTLSANQSLPTQVRDNDNEAASISTTNDLNKEIDVEIDSLVDAVKNNPDSIEALKVLYAFYLAKRDVENASIIMDRIMEMKYRND